MPTQVARVLHDGLRVTALSRLLNTHYRLPLAKVPQLWLDLMGYGCNPATVVAANTQLYDELAHQPEYIKAQLPWPWWLTTTRRACG